MSLSCYCCCSVTQSCLALCHPIACIMPGFLVLHYLPEFAQTHAHWISDAISSFVIPFSSCSQSSPESGSFPLKRFLHQLFVSGDQSIGASASASFLTMNIQSWIPLGLTGLIFLVSKGLSRVFTNTTVWKHQFFGDKPSLWPSSHIHTWLLEKPSLSLHRRDFTSPSKLNEILGRERNLACMVFPFHPCKYILPLPSGLQSFCWKIR